jgi:hypothetical protein
MLVCLSPEEQTLLGKVVALKLDEYCERHNIKYIRINESDDLAPWNIEFLKSLVINSRNNIYGYSKSDESLIKSIEHEGAVLQRSEDDFVMVESVDDAKERGLVVCPGIGCGTSCLRCPKNLKTAVIRH